MLWAPQNLQGRIKQYILPALFVLKNANGIYTYEHFEENQIEEFHNFNSSTDLCCPAARRLKYRKTQKHAFQFIFFLPAIKKYSKFKMWPLVDNHISRMQSQSWSFTLTVLPTTTGVLCAATRLWPAPHNPCQHFRLPLIFMPCCLSPFFPCHTIIVT